MAIVRKNWKYIKNQLGKSGLWETGKCFKLWPNRALAGVRSKLFIRATVNAEVQEHEIGSNSSAPVYHMRYPTSPNRNVCTPVDSGNGLGMKADGTRLKKRTTWTSAYNKGLFSDIDDSWGSLDIYGLKRRLTKGGNWLRLEDGAKTTNKNLSFVSAVGTDPKHRVAVDAYLVDAINDFSLVTSFNSSTLPPSCPIFGVTCCNCWKVTRLCTHSTEHNRIFEKEPVMLKNYGRCSMNSKEDS